MDVIALFSTIRTRATWVLVRARVASTSAAGSLNLNAGQWVSAVLS